MSFGFQSGFVYSYELKKFGVFCTRPTEFFSKIEQVCPEIVWFYRIRQPLIGSWSSHAKLLYGGHDLRSKLADISGWEKLAKSLFNRHFRAHENSLKYSDFTESKPEPSSLKILSLTRFFSQLWIVHSYLGVCRRVPNRRGVLLPQTRHTTVSQSVLLRLGHWNLLVLWKPVVSNWHLAFDVFPRGRFFVDIN